ncbi:MAG: hypothetical protein ABSG25_03600 [Bryobacteraceae bacterium]
MTIETPSKKEYAGIKVMENLPRFPNVHDPRDTYEHAQDLVRRAGEHINSEVKRLQALGIIDANGRRIRTELPPDMRPGSKTET